MGGFSCTKIIDCSFFSLFSFELLRETMLTGAAEVVSGSTMSISSFAAAVVVFREALVTRTCCW